MYIHVHIHIHINCLMHTLYMYTHDVCTYITCMCSACYTTHCETSASSWTCLNFGPGMATKVSHSSQSHENDHRDVFAWFQSQRSLRFASARKNQHFLKFSKFKLHVQLVTQFTSSPEGSGMNPPVSWEFINNLMAKIDQKFDREAGLCTTSAQSWDFFIFGRSVGEMVTQLAQKLLVGFQPNFGTSFSRANLMAKIAHIFMSTIGTSKTWFWLPSKNRWKCKFGRFHSFSEFFKLLNRFPTWKTSQKRTPLLTVLMKPTFHSDSTT